MNQQMYFHPHVTTGKGKKVKTRRATVSAIVTPSEDKETLVMRLGVSVCSEKDQFIKARGRDAAGGKAKSSHPNAVIPLTVPIARLTEAFVQNAISTLSGMGYQVLPKPNGNNPNKMDAAVPN